MLQVTSVTIQGTTMGVRMFSQCYQLTSISMANLLAIPEGAHSVSRMHDPTAPRTLCVHTTVIRWHSCRWWLFVAPFGRWLSRMPLTHHSRHP